ncbi:hypothetical protein BHE74_00015585 [Ensete ventricosum]|nr:hypothetical protein BHE74_00015585 [Ensete ventricosum]
MQEQVPALRDIANSRPTEPDPEYTAIAKMGGFTIDQKVSGDGKVTKKYCQRKKSLMARSTQRSPDSKPLHISNRTARYGRYIPVCPLTSMRTARYQAVPPIGVVSPREKKKNREKTREKKRENLEIQRCSPDPDLSLVASRCFAGRIFADRGEKKTTRDVQTSCRGFTGRFLLPARTYRGEETSPCVGRRNEATNEQRWKRPISMKLTKDLNVDLHLFKGQWYLYLGSLITKDQTTIKPCQKCNSLN